MLVMMVMTFQIPLPVLNIGAHMMVMMVMMMVMMVACW